MNRLAPLIDRAPARSGRARAWEIDALDHGPVSGADLRQFLTAFIAGLIVFGTFLA
jgi:hypothetical protein